MSFYMHMLERLQGGRPASGGGGAADPFRPPPLNETLMWCAKRTPPCSVLVLAAIGLAMHPVVGESYYLPVQGVMKTLM